MNLEGSQFDLQQLGGNRVSNFPTCGIVSSRNHTGSHPDPAGVAVSQGGGPRHPDAPWNLGSSAAPEESQPLHPIFQRTTEPNRRIESHT